jgi:nucleotide-binding universal stress UspA family protein
MTSSDLVSERETSTTAQYRVIAASDFSPLGDCAVVEALRICATRPHSMLNVITVAAESAAGVILPGPASRPVPKEAANETARVHLVDIVDDYLAQKHRLGLEKIAFYVTVGGTPAAGILSLAAELDADLIVLGTHGRNRLAHMIHRSVTEEVMRRAACGVFVIRPRDFLLGEKLPVIDPPLTPGQHSLLRCHTVPTYHYEPRSNRRSDRIMPSL